MDNHIYDNVTTVSSTANGCKIFERMREAPGRRMFPPKDVPNLPLMYGIVATKA